MNTAIQIQGRGAQIVEFLADTSVERKFCDAMETRAVRPFIQSVMLEVARRPDLWACDPESVMVSALQIALLRLSVEPTLGHAYLVPFKEHGVAKCTKIVGYKGLKQLALRTHMYEALNVARVWEGERIEEDRMSGRVEIVGKATSCTKIVGRVAYFKMIDGYEKWLPMTTVEIHEHARKFSKGYDNPMSAWRNPRMVGTMEEKTPFRLLILRDGYLDPFDMGLVKAEEQRAESRERIADASVVSIGISAGSGDPTTTKPTRTAEEIRAWLHEKADEIAKAGKRMASVQQRGLMVQVFGRCWDFEPNADMKRQAVLKAITGFDADGMSNQIPAVYVLALLEWLHPEQVEGRWVPCEEAKGEARAVFSNQCSVDSGG